LNRLYVWTAIALVVGAVAGALLVGGVSSPFAPKTGILIHVENSGANEAQVKLDVRDTSGKLIVSNSFRAPGHSSAEKSVVNLAEGVYLVTATFNVRGAQGTSGPARLDTASCPDGSIALATFAVDSDSGVSLGTPGTGCRE
jgi:hypothetical protein